VRRPLAKRLLDLVVAALLLVVLSPVVALVLIVYALDVLLRPRDHGPLLYSEPRISQGRTFGLLKFRTLRADVLARAAGHARPLEADAANLTWLGRRILKPWYVDEVPQLWNVLRGDLKLVEQQRTEGLTYRDEVPAGLTGLAQLTKGSDRAYADFDLQYVERASMLGSWALLRYDLEILAGTVRVIARGQGLSY
jgi:lipopolysaccharide/colanic/teichoic acid biosynthesis glycosyltransferase